MCKEDPLALPVHMVRSFRLVVVRCRNSYHELLEKKGRQGLMVQMVMWGPGTTFFLAATAGLNHRTHCGWQRTTCKHV